MAGQGVAQIILGATDATRAAFASVGRNLANLSGQATSVQAKLTGIATGISTAFAAIGAVHIINQLDELNDLSKKTGIAAVTLGGIGFAAKQAGGDLQSAALATGKLNRTLAEAAAGGKDASEPFKLLGIAVTDAAGKTKSADQVLVELATAFQSLEDGPEKVALAIRIFGKAGADMIPLLNEGGKSLQKNIAYYERYSKVTPEAVAASDEFNDTLVKLRLLSGATGTELVSRFLPVFQSVADYFVEAKEKGRDFNNFLDGLADALKFVAQTGAGVVFVFNSIGKAIGAAGAAAAAVARKDFGAVKEIGKAFAADIENGLADLAKFRERIQDVGQVAGKTAGDFARSDRASSVKRPAPRLLSKEAGDNQEAILKKQLEQNIKVINEAAAEQKLAIEFGNVLAQQAYEDGFSTLQGFFTKQRQAREDNLRVTIDALDKEVSALEDFKRKATKPQDRIEADTKIGEAAAKRAKAVQEAANKDALSFNEERRALEQLQDRYNDIQANILQLQGKTLEASRARVDQQVREAAKVINQAGGDPAQAAQLRALLTTTEKLSDAKRQYAIITDAARDSEEALYLAAQESGATEIATLSAIGAARQESLKQLQTLAQAAQELADALQTPEAIAFARQLSLAFKKAAAEVDPLLQKTRELGKEMGEAIASGFGDAIVEGKSLRDVLKGIEKDLLNILIRSQVTKPLGDFLGNLIGGNGQSSGGGGLLGSIFPGLFGVSNTAFGSTSFADALAAGVIPLATGTNYVPKDMLALVHEGEAVVPKQYNDGGGRGMTFSPTFNITGPVDRRTLDQVRAEAFAGAQRALRRNG